MVQNLDTIVETIIETVAAGEEVKLLGFGKFEPVERAQKVGRNPKTGVEVVIPSRVIPVFRVGKDFKNAVK